MKTICICNQKGGVGKTTTTINIGAGLAKLGKRVLLIDLDSQGNLTATMQQNEEEGQKLTANELIYFSVAGVPYTIDQMIRHNEGEHLDYIAASPLLSTAPNLIANDPDSNTVLERILRAPELADYDYVLCDCKPSLDLLVANTLVAADGVIIPVEPEAYAVDGLVTLCGNVSRTHDQLNERLHIIGILITKADYRRRQTKETEAELRECFGDQMFKATIPILAEAAAAAKEQRSAVSGRCSRVGELYTVVAQEVIDRCEKSGDRICDIAH